MSSTTTSEPLIEVRNLHLHFHSPQYRSWTFRDLVVDSFGAKNPKSKDSEDVLAVLRGLNFKVFRQDRLAILGRNGAGKTSLCRCIAGIYRASRGEVRRGGEVRAVFDTTVGIQPELTGYENLELLSRFIYPDERSKRQDLIHEVGNFSGLGEFLHRPFKLYSNGMKARLGLSMVTARPADILILDEVFDGADVSFRAKMLERMSTLISRSGAVIFVSHTPDQIRQVCNKALVLENGLIKYYGQVEEAIALYEGLQERPVSQMI